jgi:hypothetical protein
MASIRPQFTVHPYGYARSARQALVPADAFHDALRLMFAPIGEDCVEQFVAAFEVPIEATAANFHDVGERFSPHCPRRLRSDDQWRHRSSPSVLNAGE